jgi:hypothetical protein
MKPSNLAAQQQPKGNSTYGGSSSSKAAPPASHVPAHVPLLPFTDSDIEPLSDDEASDASTVEVTPDQYLATHSHPSKPAIPQHHGKYVPCFLSSLEATVKEQELYLEEMPAKCEGPWEPGSGVADSDWIELEFSQQMSWFVADAPFVGDDEVLVIYVSKTGNKQKMMIEKNLDNLSAADVRKFWHLVEPAIRKEVKSFHDMGTFEITMRAKASNVCSSRWVHKFKLIDGVKSVKSRLTIRGFQDLSVSAETYAGTATRWGQRIVASISRQRGWKVFMSDVASAFLQSMTFDQMAQLSGVEAREVCFDPPTGCEKYFQELPGMHTYNPLTMTLRMLKAVYGLKDAPKAWKLQLDRVLRLAGGRQCHTDKCLWLWFDGSTGLLRLILSTHVDDIKGTGDQETTDHVLKTLTKEFGKLKTVYDNFIHCGIAHETLADGTLVLHQHEYAKQLILMEALPLASAKPETPLTELQHAQYLSLLGGVSWMIQTRLDVAVYVCALQRAATKPKVEHATRLNRVVKWCKRKKAQLTYRKLRTPTRVIGISDSAFRKEDAKGLAMRGAIVALAEWFEDHPGGACHIFDFYARKQRRVTRSTYSAELNGASDCYEFSKLVALTIAECIRPYPTISALMSLEETGSFPVSIELIIDARSVYDSLVASELKAPTEISLIMFLSQLKEQMLCWSLRRLWWVDTRDMAADGLNKGACSRAGLLAIANNGRWDLLFKAHGFSETRYQPILSQKDMVQMNGE